MNATIYTTNEYGEYISKKLTFGSSLSGATTIEEAKVVPDTDFLGIGVAITGSSCYNLSKMEPEERHKLLKFLYTKEGLDLKIGRLSVGASDYSVEIYTYDDVSEDVSLEHFSIERDKEYIIPMIKEILAIKPDLFLFASPWSPPAWMKTGGSIGGGFMREKYLECYAEYFVKYIKAYEAEGIKIRTVTAQNETETHQNGKMPACLWHPEIEVKFIQILKRKFKENGIDTKIWCYDHNFSGADRVDWCFETYPELKDACDGVAFHYYSGSIEQTTFLKEKYKGINLHFTEGGPRLYDNYATDWCKWGLMVIKALSNGYSSFIGWNLMLDETGGPNVGPFFCGGLVTRNSLDNDLSYSGQYKAFRHFTDMGDKYSIYPLDFYRNTTVEMFEFPKIKGWVTEGCVAKGEDGKIILYLVNPSEEKEQLQYFYNNKWWYIELLPRTLATIVFED